MLEEICGIRTVAFSVKEKQPMQHHTRCLALLPTKSTKQLVGAVHLSMFSILDSSCSKRYQPVSRTKDVKTERVALLSLALMSYASDWPARSQYNGLSDSFLLTCGGIELLACHPKTFGYRLLGPNKTGPN